MPYDDDTSIPPTGKQRRRDTDRINWIKVAKAVVLSSPAWASIVWIGFGYLFEIHAQWLVFQQLPDRIEQLEQRAKEHADIEKKLASLERYRCILGYDPGGKLGRATILARDNRQQCQTPPSR
jgi:hypothetical protein